MEVGVAAACGHYFATPAKTPTPLTAERAPEDSRSSAGID